MWLTLTLDGALVVDDAGEELLHVAPDFCGGVAISHLLRLSPKQSILGGI